MAPTLPSQAEPGLPEPEALVVRTPNWLGDLMLSTAFLSAAVRRFPRARIDLIVRKGFETLPLPHRGEVLPYDRRAASPGDFGRALRGRGYTHFFVLPPSFSSAWMAFRSGVPHRIGYAGEARSLLLRPARRHRARPRSIHLVAEYLGLLAPWLRAEPEAYPPSLPVGVEWVAAHLPPALGTSALAPSGRGGAPEAAPRRYIVLAPGAEYGPAKQWPAAHYRRAAAALHGAGWRIVVAGLPGDRPLGEAILAGAPGGLNLCGETALPGLVALLARAALLVSNDSGAMHIAAALGTPQVALFGSTNPVWTGPLNPQARVVYRALPCSPCYRRVCPLGHTDCLVGIAPEAVVQQALALLNRRPP